MRLFSLVFIIILMSACGGGGSSSSPTPPPASVTPPPTSTPVAKTTDLVVSPEFEFMSSYQVTVNLPANTTSGRYFVNVCTQYNDKAPIVTNYDSCKIRSFLASGVQKITLTLSESERNLVAQIWEITPSAEPKTSYFTSQGEQAEWQISF